MDGCMDECVEAWMYSMYVYVRVMDAFMYVCVYGFVYACMYVFMYVCVYVCMYVCMSVFMYVCM